MKRIASSDAVANAQSYSADAGTPGHFAESPNPTHLTPKWCESVQEAIVRTIEGAGETPDDTYDQFTAAVSGSFGVKTSNSTMTTAATIRKRALVATTSATVAADYGVAVGGSGGTVSGTRGAQVGGNNGAVTQANGAAVGGDGNIVAGAEGFAGGGAGNTVSAVRAAVLGGLSLTASAARALAAGGQSNTASAVDTACVGGYGNAASSFRAAAVGGSSHVASGADSGCFAGVNGTASSDEAVTVGGEDLTASAVDAIAAGGHSNLASGADSGCFAGNANQATDAAAVVLGGAGSTAQGARSGVLAGYANDVLGDDSAVVACDSTNVSSDQSAAVGCLHGRVETHDGLVLLASKYARLSEAAPSGGGAGYAIGGGASALTPPGGSGNANLSWLIASDGGDAYFGGTVFGSTDPNADVAEMFENADGVGEIPPGTLVTRVGRKVRPAGPGDRILGVVSPTPFLLAGTAALGWARRYQVDEWGRPVRSYVEMVRWAAADGRPAYDGPAESAGTIPDDAERYTVSARVESPDYDPARPAVPRTARPDEWTPVALLGQVRVRIGAGVVVDDLLTGGPAGAAAPTATPRGRPVEVMEILTPYDAARGYGVALCLVG